ncbi:LuxR C-terminal-related transcriptional regulator [Aldersonia sp. NBC_00410]|uniref:helix-turn-helix transcriptional regulator n=1 Tax=Aldersonia sp. NBC_00410 TaxID=2975954 RepID=UPI00225A9BB3|nr:LuxR family transcriptional regulator [Aldersonia sp. NBC_00410]MCX5043105.1 LuxR C-terminal-related transcriptional regulator [Aldersonia sp. NBC_00410]
MRRVIRAAECVGRDAELAALAQHCAAVTDTGAAFVIVSGDAGIGKSAVVHALLESHRSRYGKPNAMWARAFEWESDHAGAVLTQLLQGEVGISDAEETIAARVPATDPLLLVVDDAEFADDATLRVLIGLVARRRALPVLVVLATRTGRARTDVPAVAELRLRGLDTTAVAQLAHHHGRALHPAMAERLAAHTDGNPAAVVALLDELPASVWSNPAAELTAPAYVVADVRDRLDGATPDARALIEALAILDQDAPAALIELSGVDDLFAAIDQAVDTGIVVRPEAVSPAEVRPRLRNPVARAAVIGLMGVAAAGAAHRRAADIVVDPAHRLHHLVAATSADDPALADELDRLARARGADGEWSEAARLFRQASRLTPEVLLRDERLTRSVDALLAAGDCVGAGALVPAIESLRETPLRNATLAYLAILRGRAAEAGLRLDRAWGIVNVERDPETAALIAQRLVLHSLVRCDGDVLVHWADRAVELAGSSSPAGVEAAAIRGLGVAWSGHPREASRTYETLSERVGHGAQAQRFTMGRGWLELGLDEIDAARANLEAAMSMAQLGGSDRITLWALAWLARVQFVTGEWDRALQTAGQALALAGRRGITIGTPLLEWTVAQVHTLRGDWTAAERAVRSADAAGADYAIMAIPAMLAKAQLAEASADYAKVARTLTPLTRMAERTPGLVEPGFWPWVDVLANALVIEGRLDDADELLRPHEQRAAEREHRSAQARLGYARGRLLGAAGDIPGARESFDAAIELLEGLPLRYDLARINFAYGQTLRRAGKRRAADEVIGTARELYLSLGATTYVQRCERELKAGGMHTPRGSSDDVELTPQEEAVAVLVANGMSNREVAAELFISPKTVQYHLTRIYAKLGLRSRSELAAARR